jgi:hypothetical protein
VCGGVPVQINANKTLTGGLRLGSVIAEDDKCTDIGAAGAMSRLLAANNIAVIIGGVSCSSLLFVCLCVC